MQLQEARAKGVNVGGLCNARESRALPGTLVICSLPVPHRNALQLADESP